MCVGCVSWRATIFLFVPLRVQHPVQSAILLSGLGLNSSLSGAAGSQPRVRGTSAFGVSHSLHLRPISTRPNSAPPPPPRPAPLQTITRGTIPRWSSGNAKVQHSSQSFVHGLRLPDGCMSLRMCS